ncbi:MAG TPA: contractile injection system protein, VgrG/Pvc8 family, partial [Polyangia bacterium]|nr:contractile injection system protein, VgrG/Pvc8 family [Polyangia bacterium]
MKLLIPMQARLISDVAELWLTSATGTEELGRPFSFDVHFVTFESPVAATDLMGTKMAIEVVGPKGLRHFHGIVSRFVRLGRQHDFYAYAVRLVPDLWRLTLSADCRIFGSGDPILDQVVDLLQKANVDVDPRIDGAKRSVEYFVQYRETDFNFVSRLL